MRILFDKIAPYRLRLYLARLVNGDLLTAAEEHGFGVMVTADQSLEYQALAVDAATEGSYEFVSYELPPKPKPGRLGPPI